MEENIIESYENKTCKVTSNRINFRKFDKPFIGKVLTCYRRSIGNGCAYKVKCPNDTIMIVYPSEIEIDEADFVNTHKNALGQMDDEINDVYQKFKRDIIKQTNIEKINGLKILKDLEEKNKNNPLILNAILPLISMTEIAIELS